MKKIIIILAFATYFLIMTVTLSHYGMDTDTPFHFLRGQTYLDFVLTGNRTIEQPNIPSPVLFVPGQRVSLFHVNAWEGDILRKVVDLPTGTLQHLWNQYQSKHALTSFYKHKAWSLSYFNDGLGHPPVTDILLATTNKIFYEKLGLLGDVEAYHFYVVTMAILALLCVYSFTGKVFGRGAAILATLTMAFYPLFFAEAHFNIKDIPLLSYFTVALTSFYYWVSTHKSRYFVSFTLFLFLGLGTKLNILILPAIILPWLWSVRKTQVFKSWFNFRLFIYLIVFLFLNLALVTLLWPLFWENAFQKLYEMFVFYKEVGSVDLRVQQIPPFTLPLGINILSIVLFITTTPIVSLLFFIMGIITILKSKKKESILILLWLFVPFARVIILSADIFGSTRQYLEFLPAFAITAGIGGQSIIKNLESKIKNSAFSLLFFIFYFLFSLIPLIRLHPNQNVYANLLFGGTKGAYNKEIFDWKTTLTNPYRQAVNWLNQNAEKDARLAIIDGTMFSISPLWLRDDISFGSYFSGLDREGEYLISITYPKAPVTFGYLYLERFLTPVYEVKADGITLAKIWKNEKKYTHGGYSRFVSLDKNISQTRGSDGQGDFWELDLGGDEKIVKLALDVPRENCQDKSGLFQLENYYLPYRVDNSDNTSDFFFPAVKSRFIRFYSLVPNTCLLEAKILDISVISDFLSDY